MSSGLRYSPNRPTVIDEMFDDEYVLVNLKNGSYYALTGVGATIWGLVAGGATHGEIVAALSERFEANDATLQDAVQNLLHELEQEELIIPQRNISAGTPGSVTPRPSVTAREPFTLPVLEKHTDMKEVLQLDPIHEVDASGWPARQVE